MSSAIRPSASSGVCLNLKVSLAAAGGGALPLAVGAAVGAGFLDAGAADADGDSFEAEAPGGFFV